MGKALIVMYILNSKSFPGDSKGCWSVSCSMSWVRGGEGRGGERWKGGSS